MDSRAQLGLLSSPGSGGHAHARPELPKVVQVEAHHGQGERLASPGNADSLGKEDLMSPQWGEAMVPSTSLWWRLLFSHSWSESGLGPRRAITGRRQGPRGQLEPDGCCASQINAAQPRERSSSFLLKAPI